MDSISCARAVPVAARATRQRAANRISAILRIKVQPPGYGFEAGTSGLIQSTANGLRSGGLLASWRQDSHALIKQGARPGGKRARGRSTQDVEHLPGGHHMAG